MKKKHLYPIVMMILSSFLYANNTQTQSNISYSNKYTCSIFPSVLTSYTHITSSGSNEQACYTANIAYPKGEIDGNIKCDPNGCGGTGSCQRIEPPLNKYRPTLPVNSKTGTDEKSNPTELTALEYGNLNYNNKTIHFKPSHSYNNNNTKIMLLGNVSASKSTLRFEPGDYYFDSLTIDNNNNKVELPNGGPVRIFIRDDFNVSMNNLDFNTNGSQNDLFVYVGGNFNSLGNDGGTTSWRAYMYIKGDALLKNDSNNWKIYGGITAEGTIAIEGNNPDFIQQGDEGESLGYGKCKICYTNPVGSNGLNFFGIIHFCSWLFPCDMNVPVKNFDNNPLDDVTIVELHKTLADFGWGDDYSVLDKDGKEVPNTSADKVSRFSIELPMGFNIRIKDKAIIYNAGDN